MKDFKLNKTLSRAEMRSISGGKVEIGDGGGSPNCVYAQYQLCGGSSSAPCFNKTTNSCDTCCIG